jgi:site-specific recombinase XerD
MERTNFNQGIITDFEQDTYLPAWIDAFVKDRQAQQLSPKTVQIYRKKLAYFKQFCDGRAITSVQQITAQDIRDFMIQLQESGHNPGGIHMLYRNVRAFLYWYEKEVEPENWKNPIHKVKAPRLRSEPLPPTPIEDVKKMAECCDRTTFNGARDYAILLCLFDCGARANEFVNLNLEDVNLINGEAVIRHGKGDKSRVVFFGRHSRKALRFYLKKRHDQSPALWVNEAGERLIYMGLREVIRRRAEKAGVKCPSLHGFRRAFALTFLRDGGDVFSLQRLMGHADLQILRRYLAQTTGDLQAASAAHGPIDLNW